MARIVFSAIVFSVWLGDACAQPAKKPPTLTVDRIYKSSEFRAKSAGGRWLKDSSGYTLLSTSKTFRGRQQIVKVDAKTGERETLVPPGDLVPSRDKPAVKIESYRFSKGLSHVLFYTNSRRVWRANTRGDYWVLDRAGHDLFQLGKGSQRSSLMFAKFSPNTRYASYVRDRDIYIEDLRNRTGKRLTKSPARHIIHGTFDWVYEEELGLRDGTRWSPDSRHIAFWKTDSSGVREVTLVENTAGLYPQPLRIPYPKVGQQNSAVSVGVVSIPDGRTRWIPIPGDPREHYIARMDWIDANRLYVQQLNRLQNENRVYFVDLRTLTPRLLFVERDKAWVNMHNELMLLDGGKEFTWMSERDGWRQLFIGDWQTGKLRQITKGKFDVIQLLKIDEKAKAAYFIASPNDPGQRYLYKINLDGTGLVRLSPQDQSGSHSYRISPDAKFAIHTISSMTSPPVAKLISLPDHKVVRSLEENAALKKKLNALPKTSVEFFKVFAGKAEMHGWCIKPPNFDPNKKYPLLIYVYGEPAGQTVVDRWGGSSQLWHMMMAHRGCVVISMDNRGTRAPKGRAWRKSIYRKVGIIAPTDQAEALKSLLKSRPYLDAKRVAIWGWSGGGSMSLNAIFKHPDLYHTAISIAPVPNQRLYDTIYQERYMGLPNDNASGYWNGSPINFAKNLKGNLLLIHGTGDDNCHYQGMDQLIHELITHNKQFEMMAYPFRSHSIREGTNTTRHLRTLMTRYLEAKLLNSK